VAVHPDRTPERSVDLYRLALDLNAQGISFPLLLRFSDILKARIQQLSLEFRRAITDYGYQGRYTSVYPIKVNQQRHVVEEIVEFGAEHGVGLECGSKPELQAVLGLGERTDHLIVCNGYKDEEFMRLALMGQRLGHQVFIVLEQLGELDEVLRVADEMRSRRTWGSDQAGHRLGPVGQSGKRRSGRAHAADPAARAAPGGKADSSSWSISISAARSPTSATSRRASRRSAGTTSRSGRWASTSRPSTSAAAWASTTMARGPPARPA
jgi:hypothetical protein